MQTNATLETIRHHRDPFAKRVDGRIRRQERKAAIARKSLFLILI